MRYQSWSKKDFQAWREKKAAVPDCSRAFSRIPSRVVVVVVVVDECRLVLLGPLPMRLLLGGLVWVTISTSREQRTLPEEHCLFTDQLAHYFTGSDPPRAFLSKDNVFHVLLSTVFVSLMLMIYFIREL